MQYSAVQYLQLAGTQMGSISFSWQSILGIPTSCDTTLTDSASQSCWPLRGSWQTQLASG